MPGKILIIDDDADFVESVKLVLEAHDYEVHTAPTGEDGLRRAKSAVPDLIILDVLMEDETAGLRVCRTLRDPDPASEYAACRQVPLLMVTSLSERQSLLLDWGGGPTSRPVDAFIHKPVTPGRLLEKVTEFLNRG